jgi:hypothetical protein
MRYLIWLQTSLSLQSLYDYKYCQISFNRLKTAQRVQKVILSALTIICMLIKVIVAESSGINLYFCWTEKRIED